MHIICTNVLRDVIRMYFIRVRCVTHAHLLQIYDSELEKVREFGGFEDHFETFPLVRGRLADDDEDEDGSRIVGKFKVTKI